MHRSTHSAIVALILSLALAASARAALIVPLNGAAPDGRSYADLAADWWQWALAIPAPISPLLDNNGEFAGVGQAGQVFFLAPSLGGDFTRDITVSDNTYLFIPVVTAVVFNAPGETYTEHDIRTQLDDFLGNTSVLYAALDGQQIPDLWTYRASSPAGGFSAVLPEDNIYGVDPGTYAPAVADGWWLLLQPLSPGQHTLRFEGGTGDPNNNTFYQGASYNITVVPEPAALSLLAFATLFVLRRKMPLN